MWQRWLESRTNGWHGLFGFLFLLLTGSQGEGLLSSAYVARFNLEVYNDKRLLWRVKQFFVYFNNSFFLTTLITCLATFANRDHRTHLSSGEKYLMILTCTTRGNRLLFLKLVWRLTLIKYLNCFVDVFKGDERNIWCTK